MKQILEKRNISTEIKQIDTESRKISGLAIPVESRSELLSGKLRGKEVYFYETISREAVNDDLIKTMDVKLYLNHDSSQGTFARSKYGIGSLHLFITERGLEFETELPNTVFGDTLLEGIRRGDYDAMSFCFAPGQNVWDENADGTYDRTIRSIDILDECSILSCAPAYSDTDVNLRSLETYVDEKDRLEEERKISILTKLDERLHEIKEITKI